MTKETNSVLFKALSKKTLSEETKSSRKHAASVVKGICESLDRLRCTHIAYDADDNEIKRPHSECSPEQHLRAAKMFEYDLRDKLAIARNNGAISHRITKLEEELAYLLSLMPTRLADDELEAIIIGITNEIIPSTPDEVRPQSVVGSVLRRLSTDYFGCYDGRMAREITTFLVDSQLGFPMELNY